MAGSAAASTGGRAASRPHEREVGGLRPRRAPPLGRRDGRRALSRRRRGGHRRRAPGRHRLRVGTAVRRRRGAVRGIRLGVGGGPGRGERRARRHDRGGGAAAAAHRRGRPRRRLAARVRLVLRFRRRHRPTPGRRAAHRGRPAGPGNARDGLPGGDGIRGAGGVPALQPAEPHRGGPLPRRAGRRWPRWRSSTGSASSPTRCTRRSSTRGVGGSRRSSPSPGPSGPSPCSRPRRGGTSRG